MKKSFIIYVFLIAILSLVSCEKWCDDTYPEDNGPTLYELSISSGDSIGTTVVTFELCEDYANLWGVAHSTCNVGIYDNNDTQFAGGWILIKTEDVEDLPELAYTTFDESLNKLEYWETKPIFQAVPDPVPSALVNYFAENIRPKVYNPNNPTQYHTFVNAIVQPAETKELDGQAIVGVDKIWITW